MSHPDGLPDLFLDRSLGRIRVPGILREEGPRLVTLAERYGIPEDERVTDERWLRDTGRLGEAVFMKDSRVRYKVAEKRAITQFRARCFGLARQDLRAEEMAARFLNNLHQITEACRDEGPFIYAVHARRIDRIL